MFPTLKLFSRITCPDLQLEGSRCTRTAYCPFHHDRVASAAAQAGEAEKAAPRPSVEADPSRQAARTADAGAPAAAGAARGSPAAAIALVPLRIQLSTSSAAHTFPAVRQKLLEALCVEFLKLYEHALRLPPPLAKALAHRDSLAQELDCLRLSNKATYRNSVITAIVKIRRRSADAPAALASLPSSPNPPHLGHPLAGTNAQYELAKAALTLPPPSTNPPTDKSS